eukprot:294916-Chlamydomonas_euryale.AAC.1
MASLATTQEEKGKGCCRSTPRDPSTPGDGVPSNDKLRAARPRWFVRRKDVPLGRHTIPAAAEARCMKDAHHGDFDSQNQSISTGATQHPSAAWSAWSAWQRASATASAAKLNRRLHQRRHTQ